MNKKFTLLLVFLFILNCSLDTKSGFWSQSEKIKSENNPSEEKLFANVEVYEKIKSNDRSDIDNSTKGQLDFIEKFRL